MKTQIILHGKDNINSLIRKLNINKMLIVHSPSYNYLPIKDEVKNIGIDLVYYGNVTPNPLYEDVCKVVSLFKTEQCNAIMAIGGGSSIDTAKCIKLFYCMDDKKNYLEQEYTENSIPLIAVPTTAGTGSESTSFIVIYYNGEKQSLSHESILPDYAILIPELLKTLPLYQKKCTFLDALCQGIESWWSVKSNEESKEYSKNAIEKLTESMHLYFSGNESVMENIMEGANYAGRAINIAQTTAPHAMSYKLTSLYGLPHGHAVAICLPEIWRFMTKNIDKCTDPRGSAYISAVFKNIALALGYSTVSEAIDGFSKMLNDICILPLEHITDENIDLLAESINPIRMRNSPIFIDKKNAYTLYQNILKNKKEGICYA